MEKSNRTDHLVILFIAFGCAIGYVSFLFLFGHFPADKPVLASVMTTVHSFVVQPHDSPSLPMAKDKPLPLPVVPTPLPTPKPTPLPVVPPPVPTPKPVPLPVVRPPLPTPKPVPPPIDPPKTTPPTAPPPYFEKPQVFQLPFTYTCESGPTFNEVGSFNQTASPYWWLNSGGSMLRGVGGVADGDCGTLQGRVQAPSRWHVAYGQNGDTDFGDHPQNLFRLFTRTSWQDIQASAYFKINADNLSASMHRFVSNGTLLMLRATSDGQNLYYGGVRVDGHFVIKKKVAGKYYTLAEQPYFPGTYKRDVAASADLLPKGRFFGIRFKAVNLGSEKDGQVRLTLSIDLDRSGNWKELATVIDDGSHDGPAMTASGLTGIRTDFMDVEFDDFSLQAP